MPRVYNKHHGPKPPQDAVYIGRPTKWGNPFIIGADGTRMEVIRKYREYVFSNPDLMETARIELKGKDLLCFCAPVACHGDVLLEVVNKRDEQ